MNEEKRYVYKPEDIQQILKIGRTSVYKLLKSGQIKSKKIGKLYRIPVAYFDEYMAMEQSEAVEKIGYEKGGD